MSILALVVVGIVCKVVYMVNKAVFRKPTLFVYETESTTSCEFNTTCYYRNKSEVEIIASAVC